MARSLFPQYYPQVQQTEKPYLGDYSALAQRYLRGRNEPVYSIGQGLANVAGDIGTAYFEKKAAEKDAEREERKYRALAEAFGIAGNPNLTTRDVNPAVSAQPAFPQGNDPGIFARQLEGQAVTPPQAQEAFPTLGANERTRIAMQFLGNRAPKLAVENMAGLQQIAKNAEPPTFTGPLGKDQRYIINNKEVIPRVPREPELLTPEEIDQKAEIAARTRGPEPLVEVADPTSETGVRLVPRSEAVGRESPSPQRQPRSVTAYTRDGQAIRVPEDDPAFESGELSLRAPRNLSEGARKDLGDLSKTADAWRDLDATFEDEFAGNPVTGGLETMLGKMNKKLASEGQPEFWQKYQELKNVIRNQLFGSALTATEKAEFEKANINERTDPELARENLKRQVELVETAMQRIRNSYLAGGYNMAEIDALFGDYQDDILIYNPETGEFE